MPQEQKKKRTLMVLTRDQGAREENPLLTTGENEYYLPSYKRTPQLRAEADALMPPVRVFKKGTTIAPKKNEIQRKFLKQKGY